MSEVVETIARAMQESDAWPVVFAPGSAESLARSAITALEANGYAIVPIEPTDEMISAGIIERHDQPTPEAWSLATANIYRAMISTGKAKA
ncbi:hypothetical protein [Sphingopyxis sp. Geo48]|uniref:hypothetical protein n=1 Tax=Sphingopyxis sp. Geo48 TaxID=545241 RepID=UPI0024B7BFA6|nr:hypothetical protein [Sphingopyxis sp. Geo48]